MLAADDLRKRFGDVEALAGLSLHVRANELLTVLGPSGSGKSTLLRVIAGLEQPDAGRVMIGDDDVTQRAPGARGVALVFQSFALFPHLSVAGNIGFGLDARREAERAGRVRAAATALGLGDLLERRPATLSGGERQRVALARALAGRPRVLLLDEPLSNLDAPLRERAREEIRRVHGEAGCATVHVTHDQVEALALGDRVAVVDAGTVQQVDAPDALYDRPADLFVAAFVGRMNVVRPPELAGALPAPPRPGAVAGFRPEALVEDPAGFEARVERSERAGHEHLWHLRCGEQALVARAPGPAPGPVVRVGVDAAAVRWFDPSDGRAL